MTDRTYPLDSWRIREIHFDPEMIGRNETVFALGNGNFGMRGNFEEGRCNVVNGTYINGFYEESPIVYGETAYGYAKNRQVMLNIADAKIIRPFINGEPFDLSTGKIIAYQRTLDLSNGILSREVRWASPAGRHVEIKTRRLVSLVRRHIAAIEYTVTAKGEEIDLELESAVDGRVVNQAGKNDPRIGTHLAGRALETLKCEATELRALILQRTKVTKMAYACAVEHEIELDGRDNRPHSESTAADEEAVIRIKAHLARDESLRLVKYIGYCTSKELEEAKLEGAVYEHIDRARASGFGALAAEQADYVHSFWKAADIEIGGDDAVQQGLRFNVFSLLQSAGRDGKTSIAAKGLTGEGYEGHYFWDTEIYVLPFFVYTDPAIARSMLSYRCGILDKARTRASEMNQKGALFPWRTIGGEETSPYFPAGSAQYHIDADIVFALKKYLNANPDPELVRACAAEVVFETARLWADLGDWLPARGDRRPLPAGTENRRAEPEVGPGDGATMFFINEVTGPDEYTAIVNNNAYTNLMAQFNLEAALEVAEYLKENEPREFARISKAVGLTEDEIDGWRRAAERMFVPFDRDRGITAQDDAFLQRAPWDFAGTPRERYPLLLNFHPLVIYRYQVLKQPDVVLAQVLRGDRFTTAEKRRNFDYYDPLTTGDSSLSPCIQSVAAVELGYTEQAYRYFMRTARMDLDDINGNVTDGIHTAAMAGTWISLVYGFGGMRDYKGKLSFSPRLPAEWTKLRFSVRYRGRSIGVDISHDRVAYELDAAGPVETSGPARAADEGAGANRGPGAAGSDRIEIEHRGTTIVLSSGQSVEVPMRPRLECVVLDLDGVITDTAEYHFQAWSRLAEEIGAPIDREFNSRLRGVSRMESLELILEHGHTSLSAGEKQELAERKNRYYRELIAQVTPDDLLPGIGAFLDELGARGIRTAIASVSHNVWEVVRRLEIGDSIDLIVDPASVVKGKPDPEIFLSAAETLRFPAEHCVGVEDAQAGIDAIRAARMFAVGIGSDLRGADWLLADTSGLTVDALVEHFDVYASRR